MRRIYHSVLLALGLALVGCGKDPETLPAPAAPKTPPAEVGGTPAIPTLPPAATAPPPGSGMTAVGPTTPAPLNDSDLLGGNGRPLTAEEKMLLNYGIDMFHTEKGRYPKDLAEAVASKHITRLPKLPPGEELSYDPASGKVNVVKK